MTARTDSLRSVILDAPKTIQIAASAIRSTSATQLPGSVRSKRVQYAKDRGVGWSSVIVAVPVSRVCVQSAMAARAPSTGAGPVRATRDRIVPMGTRVVAGASAVRDRDAPHARNFHRTADDYPGMGVTRGTERGLRRARPAASVVTC
ncbi:hypothetical protein GCM10022220_25230 [Actinocatenispora rupis]|uniref:Uncharacterized protein n=1 Tax=Actinocatenispora rupis TaxID=519421 RepID=A0A8J3NFF2_9ACTN|nr:hypothetical protein Aru02nite_61060 [Actinocatenispora rupis]